MAKIVGYIAASLDGFIAGPDENLDWLTQQPDLDLGEHDYRSFIGTIRTVVMGRTTYDWIARYPGDWEYGAQRVIVVTSRPIANPKGALETRSDINALIAELRGLDDGNVWMLGAAGCKWPSWSAARSMSSRSTSSPKSSGAASPCSPRSACGLPPGCSRPKC